MNADDLIDPAESWQIRLFEAWMDVQTDILDIDLREFIDWVVEEGEIAIRTEEGLRDLFLALDQPPEDGELDELIEYAKGEGYLDGDEVREPEDGPS